MNAENFCYWAQGFLEVAKPENINSVQLQEIKNHLQETLKPRLPQISGLVPTCGENWGKITEQKEKEQIFITITNHPTWSDEISYSDYTCRSLMGNAIRSSQYDLLKNLGIDYYGKSTNLIVDNDLKPTADTNFSELQGKNNHLVGASRSGCGLLNIGTFSDSKALLC